MPALWPKRMLAAVQVTPRALDAFACLARSAPAPTLNTSGRHVRQNAANERNGRFAPSARKTLRKLRRLHDRGSMSCGIQEREYQNDPPSSLNSLVFLAF